MSHDLQRAAMVAVTTTSLEMRSRPFESGRTSGSSGHRIERIAKPGVTLYRHLYNSVGADWAWVMRRDWTDERLAATVDDPAVEVWVLFHDGEMAGFAELDARQPRETELAYFGLMPGFIGRGLGPTLLRFAIGRAWERPISRLWVHTCTFDHPAALPLYRRCGFVPFERHTRWVEDPRATVP